MRTMILAAGLALAMAAMTADAGPQRMWNFGYETVMEGDSSSVLRKKGGEPTRIVPLQNVYGATIGERWEYDKNGKTIHFTIKAGRVQSISVDE